MALIRATCSDCGDVELRSRDLRVRQCHDDESATYLFRCPVCRMIEVRPAEQHVVEFGEQLGQRRDVVVAVLLAAGVHSTEWHMPAELTEPRGGSPITHDDVLDFHDLLATPDWFSTLTAINDR